MVGFLSKPPQQRASTAKNPPRTLPLDNFDYLAEPIGESGDKLRVYNNNTKMMVSASVGRIIIVWVVTGSYSILKISKPISPPYALGRTTTAEARQQQAGPSGRRGSESSPEWVKSRAGGNDQGARPKPQAPPRQTTAASKNKRSKVRALDGGIVHVLLALVSPLPLDSASLPPGAFPPC